jgi:RNA polymerase sigma factor (sigma-70 family)
MNQPAERQGASLDAELIREIAGGNLEGVGKLFDRHAPDLRRYFARIGLPWGDIDDLVQLTFIDLIRAAPRFDPRYSARAWLFGIATTIARRHRRTLARTAARIAAWAGFADANGPRTPADLYERDEQVRRFERALARLSAKKRETFVLVTLQGLSSEEASSALGIPVNTVWTRLHHARLELASVLREEGP